MTQYWLIINQGIQFHAHKLCILTIWNIVQHVAAARRLAAGAFCGSLYPLKRSGCHPGRLHTISKRFLQASWMLVESLHVHWST